MRRYKDKYLSISECSEVMLDTVDAVQSSQNLLDAPYSKEFICSKLAEKFGMAHWDHPTDWRRNVLVNWPAQRNRERREERGSFGIGFYEDGEIGAFSNKLNQRVFAVFRVDPDLPMQPQALEAVREWFANVKHDYDNLGKTAEQLIHQAANESLAPGQKVAVLLEYSDGKPEISLDYYTPPRQLQQNSHLQRCGTQVIVENILDDEGWKNAVENFQLAYAEFLEKTPHLDALVRGDIEPVIKALSKSNHFEITEFFHPLDQKVSERPEDYGITSCPAMLAAHLASLANHVYELPPEFQILMLHGPSQYTMSVSDLALRGHEYAAGYYDTCAVVFKYACADSRHQLNNFGTLDHENGHYFDEPLFYSGVFSHQPVWENAVRAYVEMRQNGFSPPEPSNGAALFHDTIQKDYTVLQRDQEYFAETARRYQESYKTHKGHAEKIDNELTPELGPLWQCFRDNILPQIRQKAAELKEQVAKKDQDAAARKQQEQAWQEEMAAQKAAREKPQRMVEELEKLGKPAIPAAIAALGNAKIGELTDLRNSYAKSVFVEALEGAQQTITAAEMAQKIEAFIVNHMPEKNPSGETKAHAPLHVERFMATTERDVNAVLGTHGLTPMKSKSERAR